MLCYPAALVRTMSDQKPLVRPRAVPSSVSFRTLWVIGCADAVDRLNGPDLRAERGTSWVLSICAQPLERTSRDPSCRCTSAGLDARLGAPPQPWCRTRGSSLGSTSPGPHTP